LAYAAKVGVTGTPMFFVNGSSVSGAQPLESFTDVIDAELAAAAALRGKGTAPEAVYGIRVAANFAAPKPTPREEPKEDLTIWQMPIQGAPVNGPADALVTIVEFFDYQCPYCRRVEETMKELRKLYPNDVRVVLRQNPLPFHARALPAANFALEARAQKGDAVFFEAHQRLLEGEIEDADLLKLGRDLRLDEKRVRAAISKGTHNSQIEADADLASDFKASGTPHFFINGQRLSGAQPLEVFVKLVDAQLAVGKTLVAAGTPRAGVYDEIMKHATAAEAPEKKAMPPITAENPTRGPLNAPVVIHVFSDFQCPFCARVEPTLLELDKAFPNKLRFVWHDLPLPFHPHARPAAIMAREVRAQKGDAAFWKVHDSLFRDQKLDNAFSPEIFAKYASELHADPTRVEQAGADGRYDAALAHDQAIAEAAGIHGTPGFVINGYFVPGAQSLNVFKRAVHRALADLAQKPQLAAPASKP
jgi:protein-disulfide isomerase